MSKLVEGQFVYAVVMPSYSTLCIIGPAKIKGIYHSPLGYTQVYILWERRLLVVDPRDVFIFLRRAQQHKQRTYSQRLKLCTPTLTLPLDFLSTLQLFSQLAK